MGKSIIITSGKGGTGKTVFVANIGVLLAMKGKKVLLMDMDMGLRSLDLYIGLENEVVFNVMDVMTGVCGIKKALIKDRRFENLYFMAAPPYKKDENISPMHMKVLCEKLKKEFDYILIDSPAGIGEGFNIAAAGADEAIIVTTANDASLRDLDTVIDHLKRVGIKEVSCVINQVYGELIAQGFVPMLSEVTRCVNLKILGCIQHDENIYIATTKGLPIALKGNTYIRQNLENIADRIMEE